MCGFERISFMDGFSGYNQIKMYPEDEKYIVDTLKRQIPQVALQLVWMISKLVDVYKRQDTDKLTTRFCPSLEIKQWLKTYWFSEADTKPSITSKEA